MFNKDPTRLVKFRIEILTTLDELMMLNLLTSTQVYVSHVSQQNRELAKQLQEDNSLDEYEKSIQFDFLSDDLDIAKEAMSLAEELAFIGLYKTIEIRINKAVRASGLMSNAKIKGLYIKDTLIKNFAAIGIKLEAVANYKEFCELKLINNAIKHSGVVSPELASLNPAIWIVGHPITDFAKHFKRLLRPNINFLSGIGLELCSKVIAANITN